MVAIAEANRRRVRRPRTDSDHEFLSKRLEECRIPPALISLSAEHADFARRLIWRRTFQERLRLQQVHERELRTWQDIEQAIRMIDPTGHNPAPRPEPPKTERLPFFLEASAVQRIIQAVGDWHRQC